MLAIMTLLLVVILSLVVNRVATVALVFTGLSRDAARFQARSAFSGAGFTTAESELIVNHPVRRRIVMLLMLLGNAGFVTIIATLLGGFIGVQQTTGSQFEGVSIVLQGANGQPVPDMTATFEHDPSAQRMTFYERLFGPSTAAQIIGRVLTLVLGLCIVWMIANSKWVDQRMFRIIAWALKNLTKLDTRDYHGLLHFHEGFAVDELSVTDGHWMTGRNLIDLRLGDEGIHVLGIRRADQKTYVGSPKGDSYIRSGDTVIVYGASDHLEELKHRANDEAGQAAHDLRVREQREAHNEQAREDDRSSDRESEMAK